MLFIKNKIEPVNLQYHENKLQHLLREVAATSPIWVIAATPATDREVFWVARRTAKSCNGQQEILKSPHVTAAVVIV